MNGSVHAEHFQSLAAKSNGVTIQFFYFASSQERISCCKRRKEKETDKQCQYRITLGWVIDALTGR